MKITFFIVLEAAISTRWLTYIKMKPYLFIQLISAVNLSEIFFLMQILVEIPQQRSMSQSFRMTIIQYKAILVHMTPAY